MPGRESFYHPKEYTHTDTHTHTHKYMVMTRMLIEI